MKATESKGATVTLFLFALLLWGVTVIRHTLGFVAPVNGEAIGRDVWAALLWLWFLYASYKLYRAFWKRAAADQPRPGARQ